MLYNDYKKEWLGKRIDFDNAYGAQCVDLARHYHKAMFGFDMGTFGGTAWTGWLKFKKSMLHFAEIRVKKNQIPPVGAIVFFSPTSMKNTEGHVAICEYCQMGGDKIDVLEQNALGGGSGTGGNAIRVGEYDLNKVAGWIYAK